MFTTACKLSLSYSIAHAVMMQITQFDVKDVFCGKRSRLGGGDGDGDDDNDDT